jgi:hypothetical protein
MILSGTMTLFLRTAAKNSPEVALMLLEGKMTGTVYMIITGVLPPNDLARLEGEQGGGEGGQGVGSEWACRYGCCAESCWTAEGDGQGGAGFGL